MSGVTELAAAGAGMTGSAQLLAALSLPANPFGLSDAHSVDGFALWQATVPQSSIVSELSTDVTNSAADAAAAVPPATVAEGPAAAAGAPIVEPDIAGLHAFEGAAANDPGKMGVADHSLGPRNSNAVLNDRAAAAMALSDAVGAASSVISGLTALAAQRANTEMPDTATDSP